MRVYGLFRAAFIRACLVVCFVGIGGVSLHAQANVPAAILPLNAVPFLRGNETLFSLLSLVDSDRSMQHIGALQGMATRHVNSAKNMPDEGIGAASRYILGQFEAIRDQSQHMTVVAQDFSVTWAGQTSHLENIVAVIPGSEPELGAIIIGAHYDSRCSDLDDGACFAPGANDNGSGVAALLELARVLSPRHHRATIMFVAFSGEEIGRAGSIAFVEDYLQALGIPVSAMINLDIIGGSNGHGEAANDGTIRLFAAGPDDSPSRNLARTIHLIANHYMPDMEISVQDGLDRKGRYGDHKSFSDAGYPAVRFIEQAEDANRQHNGLDTIDDIHADYLRRSIETILAAVTGLADGPRPPVALILTHRDDGAYTLAWEPAPEVERYVVALRSHGSLVYDQQFEVSGNVVDWDGFDPAQYAALAVAAEDASGLIGPLSEEYAVR